MESLLAVHHAGTRLKKDARIVANAVTEK